MKEMLDSVQKNVGFVLIALVMMVAVYAIAFVFEKLIEKSTGVRFSSEKTKINKMAVMAMLAAASVVLMYFEFPLAFIAPSFYKIDLSEVPVLIGSFMLGPCAGVVIEAVKVILHLCLKGTDTAFVGDFANFILGCFFVVPSAVVYHFHKSRKTAVLGLVIGGIVLVVSGTVMNAFYLLPKYSEMYGMPIDAFIGMGSAINKSINNLFTFVAFAVAPFNLIKAVIDGTITVILYKYLSKHLKAE